MKNYKNELVCIYHKQLITKIDTISKRLLCPKCEEQTPQQFKNRIEVLRAKLYAHYNQELTKLKTLKIDIEKISDGLLTDAKKKIKKQLSTLQILIDGVVDKQVQQANRQLKLFIQKLLKHWNNLQNKKFDISFMEFEKAFPGLYQQIEDKKTELKQKIAIKIKAQVSNFYCKLFNL